MRVLLTPRFRGHVPRCVPTVFGTGYRLSAPPLLFCVFLKGSFFLYLLYVSSLLRFFRSYDIQGFLFDVSLAGPVLFGALDRAESRFMLISGEKVDYEMH